MAPSGGDRREERRERVASEVGAKEARKLKSRIEGDRGVWFGFGMFGLVGWSVALPTLAFVALGVWLDEAHPASFSWTLSMLALGVLLGCLNAWVWVRRELRKR